MDKENTITLVLTVDQVNRLLELISNYPICDFGSLFNEIVNQAKAQTDEIIE